MIFIELVCFITHNLFYKIICNHKPWEILYVFKIVIDRFSILYSNCYFLLNICVSGSKEETRQELKPKNKIHVHWKNIGLTTSLFIYSLYKSIPGIWVVFSLASLSEGGLSLFKWIRVSTFLNSKLEKILS